MLKKQQKNFRGLLYFAAPSMHPPRYHCNFLLKPFKVQRCLLVTHHTAVTHRKSYFVTMTILTLRFCMTLNKSNLFFLTVSCIDMIIYHALTNFPTCIIFIPFHFIPSFYFRQRGPYRRNNKLNTRTEKQWRNT